MNELSDKQLAIIEKYSITVKKEEREIPTQNPYCFFIGGDYCQQKGAPTEVGAYLAAIEYVLSRGRR